MSIARFAVASSLLVFFAWGCGGSIHPLYDAAKEEALRDPGPAVGDWDPDVIVHLSGPVMNKTVRLMVEKHGVLEKKFTAPGAELRPVLTVDKARVSSKDCDGCVKIDLDLDGQLEWTLLGKKGKSVPFKVEVGFDADINVRDDKGTFRIDLAPKKVRRVELKLDDVDKAVRDVLRSELKPFVEDKLLAELKPVEVGAFGSKGLPLRGVKVLAADKGLRLGLLTRSPSPTAVPLDVATENEGFTIVISADSAIDYARAAAFRQGPLTLDVVPEPTSISIGPKGNFKLGLRLWRLTGAGWWRDYTIDGSAAVKQKTVALTAKGVTEGAKSEGAVLVDPLAALAEGLILEGIADAVNTTIPVNNRTVIGDLSARVLVEDIGGRDDYIVVTGDVAWTEAKK